MKIKMVDIARHLGVSKATVSLAVNGKPGVNEETKRMVLECLEEMKKNNGVIPVKENIVTVSGHPVNQMIKVVIVNHSKGIVCNSETDLWSDVLATFDSEARRLGYLVDASGEGKFFLYNEDDSTFVPYTELKISDTTSIILLTDNGGAKLPDSYQEGELTVADQTYPYWANPENDRYDLLYAVNTRTGEKGFYQYDSQDGTYQSVDVQTTDSTKKEAKGIVGKLESLVKEHPIVLLAGGALIVVVLLVLMIMFAVKLVHRNQELDDLYDEYDIPFEDEEDDEPVAAKKSDRKAFGRKKVKDDDYDDGYDDDFNDDYDAFDDDEYADYDFDDDYDDDYDDEYDAPTGNTRNLGRSATKSKKGRKSDDYDVNFIDL